MKKQLEKLVEEFFTFPRGENGQPVLFKQNLDEMMMVIAYLYPRKFNNFTEIGCANGGSLWIYSKMLCESNAFIEAIEIRPLPSFIHICKKLGIEAISKDSSKVSGHIPDNSIDLLHIDGNHDTVKEDWELYYPKVIKGGIILLHDTIGHEKPRLLREHLEKEGYKIKTFYAEENPCGISLIKRGVPTGMEEPKIKVHI